MTQWSFGRPYDYDKYHPDRPRRRNGRVLDERAPAVDPRGTHATREMLDGWRGEAAERAGVASAVEILALAGEDAVRSRAGIVRPSFRVAGMPARMPTTEVAHRLIKVGQHWLWSSSEDVIAAFGAPRCGKSAWLAGRIIDAPGAVLVTSTRTDLYDLTKALRKRRRGPVYVFNPGGVGGIESTITFDPLLGCTDPVTAQQRAGDMVSAASSAGGGDRQFWDTQAKRALACLLHAAALGELTMRDVLRWAADPDKAQRQVTGLLEESPEPAYLHDAEQFLGTNHTTRSSSTTTLMPALSWLLSPTAAAAAAPSDSAFDVARLLASGATVYLLGAAEAHTAPLLCALTGHIAREARTMAARRPGGRLDPPLTLALDEAALVSPVPLEDWTADMGGRGVTIICAFQSRAQLLNRWGANAASIILGNAGTILVFRSNDPGDQALWSSIAGEREVLHESVDGEGYVVSRTTRTVPVIPPAWFRTFPDFTAAAFCRGMAPAVGRVEVAWERDDVRTMQEVGDDAAHG